MHLHSDKADKELKSLKIHHRGHRVKREKHKISNN